ncbi:MAG: hypothetical protein HN976_28530 [Lentisphaerae bacterium]|nr:hypothetical protein [Lentisphaerota bacterium]MBT7059076.1 hypothetical protein [Lentisphaerota bacterium]
MALFWEGDDKLVIAGAPPPAELLEAARRTLGYKNISTATPHRRSHSLCDDIAEDRDTFDTLCCAMSGTPPPSLAVWGATPQLYRLIEKLRECGIPDATAAIPERTDYWTVPYLDSKSGFRDFFGSVHRDQDSPICLTEGITCCDVGTALAATVARWPRGNGVVVKADRGVAGVGLLLLPKERVRETVDPGAFLRAWARTQPLLEAGPIVVEEYVAGPVSQGEAPSASIQGFIDAQGTARVRAVAVQSLTAGGNYVGASIGRTFLPEDRAADLRTLGRQIGSAVGRLGFRGHFGVDTIRTGSGALLCTEMNARRTSVCTAMAIAFRVLGADFENTGAVSSSERCQLSALASDMSPAQAIKLLDPILLQPGTGRSGVVPTILGSLQRYARQPTIGFVAIGSDAESATALHRDAERRLMLGQ